MEAILQDVPRNGDRFFVCLACSQDFIYDRVSQSKIFCSPNGILNNNHFLFQLFTNFFLIVVAFLLSFPLESCKKETKQADEPIEINIWVPEGFFIWAGCKKNCHFISFCKSTHFFLAPGLGRQSSRQKSHSLTLQIHTIIPWKFLPLGMQEVEEFVLRALDGCIWGSASEMFPYGESCVCGSRDHYTVWICNLLTLNRWDFFVTQGRMV